VRSSQLPNPSPRNESLATHLRGGRSTSETSKTLERRKGVDYISKGLSSFGLPGSLRGITMRVWLIGGVCLSLFAVGSQVVRNNPAVQVQSSLSIPAPGQPNGDRQSPLTVWYLGHSGFAVQAGNKLLIFDYQAEYGTPAGDSGAGGLDDGIIEPADLEGLEVYVFASHSHGDHYDPANLEWAAEVDDITYIYGWDADHGPAHHYLVGPRATAEIGGLQIYTINSHHSGVPEVAFLVQVDGRWIYHNGDYRQDYIPDFEYLATFTDHIELVFHAGAHDLEFQGGLQAQYILEHFNPGAFFPMHYGDEEEEGADFARIWAERGVETFLPVPRARGDRWEFGG
jgi:L-ascorbate metabolism protein UlaG (beta-lactamase superfamily)